MRLTFICLIPLCAVLLNNDSHGGEEEARKVARGIFETAQEVLEQGHADDALPLLEKALQRDPDLYQAAMTLGAIHEKAKRTAEAIAAYEKARDILAKRSELNEEEKKDLQAALARLAALASATGGLDGIKRKYAEELRARAMEAEKAGQPYSALSALCLLLRLNPADQMALDMHERLSEKVGPVLTATAWGGWQSLYNNKDLSGWLRWNGGWEAGENGLVIKSSAGNFFLIHMGPPRRNFILQAKVYLRRWNSWCFLLGRCQPNGSAVAFGLRLRRPRPEGRLEPESRDIVEMFRIREWEQEKNLGYKDREPAVIGVEQEFMLELECRDKAIIGRINGEELMRAEDEVSEGAVGILGNRGWQDGGLLQVRQPRLLELP